MKRLFLIMMACLLCLGIMTACEDNEDASTESTASGAETDLAPDILFTDAEGQEVHLSEFYGKPIVLNFWASWCPPCKAELPDFEAMYQTYGDRVQFVMVNLTDHQYETVEIAQNYIRGEGFTFPVYFDTAGQASRHYDLYSIPVTYFINADGSIRSHTVGMISGENLEAGLRTILGE